MLVYVDSAFRSGFSGDPSLSRSTYIRNYHLMIANLNKRPKSETELQVTNVRN